MYSMGFKLSGPKLKFILFDYQFPMAIQLRYFFIMLIVIKKLFCSDSKTITIFHKNSINIKPIFLEPFLP